MSNIRANEKKDYSMGSIYGDETGYIIKQLQNENIDISEKDGYMILEVSEDDFHAILPMDHELTTELILSPKLNNETRKELAIRYGVNATTISAVTTKNRKRSATRDLVLCSILSMDPLPVGRLADHYLMELAQPGLYISTFKQRENRRNWVLRQILLYGQEHHCPCSDWLRYANAVLMYFNMKPISTAQDHTPLPPEQVEMLERWRTELQNISFNDYSLLRADYLNRYCKANNFCYRGGKAEALKQLSKNSNISIDTVPSLFGRMTSPNSKGSRISIIELAIAMGCTLLEANILLMQSNEALLYPRRSSPQELDWVKRLKKDSPLEKQ